MNAFITRVWQGYAERCQRQDLKSDSALSMPYNYHQPQHHHAQHHAPRQHRPSSSLSRHCELDRAVDRLQDGGPSNATELIDLSRSRGVVGADRGRSRPSAAVYPHRPASASRLASAARPPQVSFNQLTRMWASAQRDGRPAEYRWRPLFNAAKFG